MPEFIVAGLMVTTAEAGNQIHDDSKRYTQEKEKISRHGSPAIKIYSTPKFLHAILSAMHLILSQTSNQDLSVPYFQFCHQPKCCSLIYVAYRPPRYNYFASIELSTQTNL
jgi:hypothetical protein